MTDDTFIQSFFNWALVRSPDGTETPFWNDELRRGYAHSQSALVLAAVELGKTLFESAEYAARNRDNHWYVYDLYKTYLMRDPDSGGWAAWESLVPSIGRESVRRGFEDSIEFANLMATMTPNGSVSSNPASLITALVDPRNQVANGMLTRDAVWSLPIVSLPGRSGLDLGLSLSYSSMVWTRSGPYIHFDEDNGSPSPGFRLDFPRIQRKVFDTQTNLKSYLLIIPGGGRIELRQVGASNVYEAGDSSYMQLIEGGQLLLRSTDGTQLTYQELNNEWRCIQVKDRNGNYLTVNRNSHGQIATVIDTLGRTVTFNYDSNWNLTSITQVWNGQTFTWVTFGWGTQIIQPSFGTLRVVGVASSATIPVITQVNLPDGSHYNFEYTTSGQASVIRRYRSDNVQAQYTVYQYESTTSDCPRLSQMRVWAADWTGINGVPAEVTTYFAVDGDGACRMTAPDGTIYKEYYGTGWQKGLSTTSEIWSGGVKQKWTTTAWTQDNTSVSYEVNPRVTETNVYDNANNRRRTTTSYYPTTSFSLVSDIFEYDVNATTLLRQTHFNYNLNSVYTDRRIVGLVTGKYIFDGSGALKYFDVFDYDYGGGSLIDTPQPPTQHDPAYNVSYIAGRGNLSLVRHTDANDPANQPVHDTVYGYNINGSLTSVTDPLWHQSSMSYTDSFSDNVSRNTFAYPTTLTDADGFSSYVQYNFDFGAKTRTEGPPPGGQAQGAIQTVTYDSIGRVERTTTVNNGGYIKYVYGPNYAQSFSTVNNLQDEAYSIQIFDGVGRVVLEGANHPGSSGGYRGVWTQYDPMGRVVRKSNPTEINAGWITYGDDSAGWVFIYTPSYDWKGRVLTTYNEDGTYSTVEYSGCGCAGGEVVTLTDEGTIDGGVAKRRQQKIYSDVLGRTVKTEILNWQGGSVYSATVTSYNARDQVTQIRQYAGAVGSGTYQDTTLTYDGYGRLQTKHVPEENAGTYTSWTYNNDGTINTVTDARGATTTFGYAGTNRHLVKSLTRTLSGSQTINSNYNYDAAGNRTSMTDSLGSVSYSYDQLSRMSSESRTLSGEWAGTYTFNYEYNLANQLTSLSIPFRSQQIGYNFDTAGRLSGVTASGFSGIHNEWPNYPTQTLTSFASNISYRAWGGVKSMTYGNTTSEQTTYDANLRPITYTLSNMNYTNSTVYPSPNYSTMSWSYGYFDDGRVEHAWDSTNNWFDRAFKYDHVGRIKEASTFRRARDLAPFPAVNYHDPYYQSISYDAWNHSSRTGKLFSGELTDVPTYVNNRRNDFQYDAAGNTTFDASYTHTFDAVGAVTRSVSSSMVGDADQFPYQPRLEITQLYSGDQQPQRREQVSRGVLYDEYGNISSTYEDTQTTSYLTSTVLGGLTLVELGLGYKTNIYALGRRIARDNSGAGPQGVTFEHHNPVMGSWVTSEGHSSYRVTGREERDLRGSELPLSNPYTYAQSYIDYKFGEPLFIEGGDPFNYSSGLTMDGLPVSESQLAHMMDTGAAVGGLFAGGQFLGALDFTGHGRMGMEYLRGDFGSIRIETWVDEGRGDWHSSSVSTDDEPGFTDESNVLGVVNVYAEKHFQFVSAAFNPAQGGGRRGQSPQKTSDPRSIFDKFVNRNPACAKIVQAAGDKLGLGNYLETPWKIVDTNPIYDQPDVIPNQSDAKLSVPRAYFDAHPFWNAVTMTRREGNKIVRGGTYLGEGYAYSWMGIDERPWFRKVNNSERVRGAILFDESLHNYFAEDHPELVRLLGVDTKGKDPGMGLQIWIRGGCK